MKQTLLKLRKHLLRISIFFNIIFFIYLSYKVSQVFYAYLEKEEKVSYYQLKTGIFQGLPKAPGQVIFIGDSQTDHFELTEFFSGRPIKNRGIAGDKTAGLLARIDGITESKPSKVFIEVGVNDILNGIPASEAAANVDTILTKIKRESPSTRIYLQSVLPTTNNIRETERPALPEIATLNLLYKELARKHSAAYIDLFPAFGGKAGLKKEYDSGDGLHLTGKGYQLWASLLREHVEG